MGGGHLQEVVARGGSTVSLFCSKTINGKNVTKQGFCKILRTKLRLRGSLLLVLIHFLLEVREGGGGGGWALIKILCI